MTDNYLHELELEEWRCARDCDDAVRHVSAEELMRPTKEELEAEADERREGRVVGRNHSGR